MAMEKLSPEEVYDRLLNVDKILTLKGRIRFYLGDVNIVVKQKDVVGNIIQEWLEEWLRHNNIAFAPNPNSQMPPDFFLDPSDRTHDLLEVKAFNYKATPAFDIADFKSYQKEVVRQPWMLYAKYLIFGYAMDEGTGIVTIKKLWLKNVWEICRPSKRYPINVQYKNNIVHKIRPANWYSHSKRILYLPFQSLEDFLAALEETVYKNKDTRDGAEDWRPRMEENYEQFYGAELRIPRWFEIRRKYSVSAGKTAQSKG